MLEWGEGREGARGYNRMVCLKGHSQVSSVCWSGGKGGAQSEEGRGEW